MDDTPHCVKVLTDGTRFDGTVVYLKGLMDRARDDAEEKGALAILERKTRYVTFLCPRHH
jgi:hypothetical protein